MRLRRDVLVAILAVGLSSFACGSSDKSPTAPSTPTTPVSTRIIELEGNMAFGNIIVGQFFEATLRIHNRGNAVLTISGMTGPSGYSASWTSGTIAPGSSVASTVRFSPTELRSYNGTLTVNGDQTSGTNTMAVSGTGVPVPRAAFTKTGSGNTVFDMPGDVTRLTVFGRWSGRGTSNFIVRINGRVMVNEVLRDHNPYEAIHLVPGAPTSAGAVVEISNSSEIVEWRFSEVR
jgi:hypothetical protein